MLHVTGSWFNFQGSRGPVGPPGSAGKRGLLVSAEKSILRPCKVSDFRYTVKCIQLKLRLNPKRKHFRTNVVIFSRGLKDQGVIRVI